jgi:hypothetical protein
MTNNIHPVVELLAARMESHPEEFAPDGEGRWAQWLDELIPFVTEAERTLLRGPMMQTFHEQVLDELLNGPDKRRKEREEQEYERNLAKSLQLTQQQAVQQQLQQYQNAVGQRGAYDYDLDRYRNAAGAQGLAGKSPNSIWVDKHAIGNISVATPPEPTLSSSTINAIKKALKL